MRPLAFHLALLAFLATTAGAAHNTHAAALATTVEAEGQAIALVTGVATTGSDRAVRRAVRSAVEQAAPQATAEQRRRWGISLDPAGTGEGAAVESHASDAAETQAGRRVEAPADDRAAGRKTDRVVLLVHGLFGRPGGWVGLREKMRAEGWAVGEFNYPSDQALDDSAGFFRSELRRLQAERPGVTVDVVAHSQGGLVVRAAIEPEAGRDVRIGRLILVATPNQGTDWARLGTLAEVREHVRLCRTDEAWSPTWMVTDGMGEALEDLLPGSEFLRRLNQWARRADVRYTVIAGDRSEWTEAAADVTDGVVSAARDVQQAARVTARMGRNGWSRVKAVVGYDDYREDSEARALTGGRADAVIGRVERLAARLHTTRGESDGPVDVASTRLEGVEDFVRVGGTHTELVTGREPGAWRVIAERLGER